MAQLDDDYHIASELRRLLELLECRKPMERAYDIQKDWDCCPRCKRRVYFDDNYCPGCGQRLEE